MDGIRYRCRHPTSSLFGPSRHCGLGLMNGPRFRYRQGLFDLLSRWPIMWTMRFVGVRRPISAFGPPDATHFYVLYQFLLQHLFFIPEASLPIKDDADPGGAVPFLQHVQPPGVTERGLDLAQEEVGGHGVTADALDGDAQFGPAARLRLSSRRRDSAEVMPPGSLPMALSFNHEWNGMSSFDS